jgi:hypothetical protein
VLSVSSESLIQEYFEEGSSFASGRSPRRTRHKSGFDALRMICDLKDGRKGRTRDPASAPDHV